MALSKLPASADFFKQLSQDYEQLRFILRVQESFTSSVANFGHESESRYLFYIIEQLEVLIFKTQQLKGKVENRLREQEA